MLFIIIYLTPFIFNWFSDIGLKISIWYIRVRLRVIRCSFFFISVPQTCFYGFHQWNPYIHYLFWIILIFLIANKILRIVWFLILVFWISCKHECESDYIINWSLSEEVFYFKVKIIAISLSVNMYAADDKLRVAALPLKTAADPTRLPPFDPSV